MIDPKRESAIALLQLVLLLLGIFFAAIAGTMAVLYGHPPYCHPVGLRCEWPG